MVHLGRSLGYLWALPNTLLGLVLGVLAFQMPRVTHGVLVFDGPSWGTLPLIRLFRRTAVTLGHVVLSNRPLEGTLLAHELHHVWQSERLGPLYLPAYLVVWVFRGYRRHPFERSATAAERGARGGSSP
ncbi:MAG: hypothetical protein ACRDI0_04710 [Actinomycetota bacterium]